MRHWIIAARGAIYPELTTHYGGLESAVGVARRIAGVKRDWAVFLPACRSNTAGTVLVRGKRRRVRWFREGREAAGLPALPAKCPACAGTGWLPLGPARGVYAVECGLCAEGVAS